MRKELGKRDIDPRPIADIKCGVAGIEVPDRERQISGIARCEAHAASESALRSARLCPMRWIATGTPLDRAPLSTEIAFTRKGETA